LFIYTTLNIRDKTGSIKTLLKRFPYVLRNTNSYFIDGCEALTTVGASPLCKAKTSPAGEVFFKFLFKAFIF